VSSSGHDDVLSVSLTLCAIVAVIWWLTGASRASHGEAADVPVDADTARAALERLNHSDLTRGQAAEGAVLRDVLVDVGMDASDATVIVEDLGFGHLDSPRDGDSASEGLSVISMKEEPARAALERAVLVGVQLARMDDDHAHVSDDAEAFQSLMQRADETETLLFDDKRRRRLDFYSKAVLVLQDRMRVERDQAKKSAALRLLNCFDDELIALQEEMNRSMSALPDSEQLLWGESTDRRMYYFKLGVTNSLRRSGHLSSLGHLYRYRGVNFDVEEAFQMAGEDEPLLLRAAGMEFSALVSLRPADVRRLTRERTLNRPFTSSES
jgi:hypothetical protein